LFFWQKNDAGKWQLLKADLPSGAGQPKVERTATTNFYQVGSVSPDSLRVAGMEEEGQLVVEDLVDHKRVELQREQWGGFPLSSALELLEYEGPGLEEESCQ
jgi:hypothetical protein